MTLADIIAELRTRAAAAELAARTQPRGSKQEWLAGRYRGALASLLEAEQIEAML